MYFISKGKAEFSISIMNSINCSVSKKEHLQSFIAILTFKPEGILYLRHSQCLICQNLDNDRKTYPSGTFRGKCWIQYTCIFLITQTPKLVNIDHNFFQQRNAQISPDQLKTHKTIFHFIMPFWEFSKPNTS